MLRLIRDLGMGGILLLSLTVLASEPTTAGKVPLPSPPKAQAPVSSTQQCVEPIEKMRRFHGSYLKHQRDKTMHLGIRTPQYSLVECISCHVTKNAQGEFPRSQDPQHFCRSCHTYAAVNIDCFQCHASQPQMSMTENNTTARQSDSLGTPRTAPQ